MDETSRKEWTSSGSINYETNIYYLTLHKQLHYYAKLGDDIISVIKSVKGFFGQIIHYKDGVKVGETWDSFIPGVKNHYDANGAYAGHSEKGFIANEVHYNRYGGYEGASYDGAFGVVHHYGTNGAHGVSTDGLFGTNTYLHDDSDKLIFANPNLDSDFDAEDVGDSFDSDW